MDDRGRLLIPSSHFEVAPGTAVGMEVEVEEVDVDVDGMGWKAWLLPQQPHLTLAWIRCKHPGPASNNQPFHALLLL